MINATKRRAHDFWEGEEVGSPLSTWARMTVMLRPRGSRCLHRVGEQPAEGAASTKALR